MAKRKTVVTDESQNVTQSASINNLGYTGNVTLKLKKGSKLVKTFTVHNNATLRLFQGIAYHLLNSKLASPALYIPNYISAGYIANPTPPSVSDEKMDTDKESQTTVRAIPHNIEITNNSCIAPFSGTFSGAAVPKINELGLFATIDQNSLLARVVLDEPIKVEAGMSLIVEWRVAVQNI